MSLEDVTGEHNDGGHDPHPEEEDQWASQEDVIAGRDGDGDDGQDLISVEDVIGGDEGDGDDEDVDEGVGGES
jgi:hypothetical protein